VYAELRLGLDLHVGRKRVAGLMRAADLQGCHRRRLTRRDPQAASTRPGRARFHPTSTRPAVVADITQQRTGEGWLYL
jgi:putative transposase